MRRTRGEPGENSGRSRGEPGRTVDVACGDPRGRRARAARRLLAGGELPDGRADLPHREPAPARTALVDHIKPRLLGHWGTSPALNLIYVHLNRLIRRTGQRVLYVAGPGHGGPAVLANVYLEGTYSEIYPDVPESVDGLRRFFRQFSTPWRRAQPCERADAGVDPRRGRARLLAGARLRRRLRRPGPARRLRRRRRRGRDRTPGGVVEGRRVPEPGPRRRRAADPAAQRVQDLRADRARAGERRRHRARCCRATATTPSSSRATTPSRSTRRWPRCLDHCHERIRDIHADGRTADSAEPTALAGDRPAHAEGVDRPRRARRRAHRGDLPSPPGAHRRRADEPRASGAPRVVDAQLPARRAVRRRRPPARRPPGAGSRG